MAAEAKHMVGGFGADKPADADLELLFDDVMNAAIATALGHAAPTKPVLVTYQTQVVAGVNYRVSATIGGVKHIIKIHKPLPHTGKGPELQSAAIDA